MEQHQGLPVAGYRPQSGDNVACVNENKDLEERVLRRIEALAADGHSDPRMLALGLTGIQQAFMWINRAVFQPARVDLPGDAQGKPAPLAQEGSGSAPAAASDYPSAVRGPTADMT